MSLIESSTCYDDNGVSLEEVSRRIIKNEAQLWFLDDGMNKLIMITQLLRDKTTDELHLFIWRLFGSGLFKNFEEIERQLTLFAKQNGVQKCSAITHSRLSSILQRYGFMQSGDEIVREVQYGN